MLRVLLSRVRATLRRSRLDDELDDELREHLAMLQERFVRNGMDPSEACYAARRQFGGVTQVKEALMEQSALPSLRTVFADLRYAFRAMSRTPSFAVAVVSVLALGIGATTAIFSIVNAVLLRPLPFEEPERLVRIFTRTPGPGGRLFELSPGKFYDWQRDAQSFEGMAMYPCCGLREFALTGRGTARTVRVTAVSAGFFELVRARPALGRVFREEEDTQ